MIRRSFLDLSKKTILKSGNKGGVYGMMFNKCSYKSFSNKGLESLKSILKSEINHETTNYSPVDQNELKTFYQNTKFQFTETEDSMNMELRKTHGNFEIIVNFQAKPPIPNEEQDQQQDDSERGIKFVNNFSTRKF
jgi:hypothetical protein